MAKNWQAILAHLGIEVTLANFSGESSNAEIIRIAKEAERAEAAAVVLLVAER